MMFGIYLLSSTFILGDLMALTYGSRDAMIYKQPSPSCIRGGASDNDLELDTFIESLIADISDSNDENNVTPSIAQESKVAADITEDDVNVIPRGKTRTKRKKRKIKNKSKLAVTTKLDEAPPVTANKAVDENEAEKEIEKENVQDIIESKETHVSQPEQTISPVTNETSHNRRESSHPERIERSIYPPNMLQRFLLSQGFIGRVLAALTVLFSEVFHRYIPDVYMFIEYLSPRQLVANEKGTERQAREGVHSQYAAFASGSTVGGKKLSKDQKKVMDAVALTKLKHVKGGVKSGKYAYLSSIFMKRHNLGKYAEEAKMYQSIIAPIQTSPAEETYEIDTEDEVETETEDWVVQALCEDNNGKKNNQGRDLTTAPSAETTVTSERTGMGAHSSKVRKKRQTSVIDAARGSRIITKTRKDLRIKSSDKDGGGGVLGRLRAVTASSGVSSRLLGAYPGDAVPITDAASRYGVIQLAKRYGYGDWSSDDEEESRDGDNQKKKIRRSRKRHKSIARKHTDEFPGLSVSFELGLSSPSMNSQTRLKRRSTSPIPASQLSRQKVKEKKSNSYNLVESEYKNNRDKIRLEKTSSNTMASAERQRNRVRRPMERTSEVSLRGVTSPKLEQSDSLRLSMKHRSSPVRAPMKRIRDHHKDKTGDDSDP